MGNLNKTSATGHDLVSNLAVIKRIYNSLTTGDFPAFLNEMDPAMV